MYPPIIWNKDAYIFVNSHPEEKTEHIFGAIKTNIHKEDAFTPSSFSAKKGKLVISIKTC